MSLNAKYYYKRKHIYEYIFEYCKDREVSVFNKEGKIISKRPESFENEGDIIVYVDEGGYSIHATAEKWDNPLKLADLPMREYYRILRSYDFVIDIDIKVYEDGQKNLKISQFIVDEFYNELKRFKYEPSIKFSGNKGFHLITPVDRLPDIFGIDLLQNKEIIYQAYLNLMKLILKRAIHTVCSRLNKPNLYRKLVSDEIIDYQIASWRHMIRIPYSLHEKTGLASIVIHPEDIIKFKTDWARPGNVSETVELSYKGNLKDILIIALGYTFFHEISRKSGKKAIRYIREVPEDELPPCVKTLLGGVPIGIRNNTMFFLINFFRCLGYPKEEIERIIKEWNEKNPEPLRDREVEYAVEYHFNRGKYAPYSCNKLREYIGRQYCNPNEICQYISHPLQYVRLVRKLKKRKKTKYVQKKQVQKQKQ